MDTVSTVVPAGCPTAGATVVSRVGLGEDSIMKIFGHFHSSSINVLSGVYNCCFSLTDAFIACIRLLENIYISNFS